jgi:hypothetical protein
MLKFYYWTLKKKTQVREIPSPPSIDLQKEEGRQIRKNIIWSNSTIQAPPQPYPVNVHLPSLNNVKSVHLPIIEAIGFSYHHIYSSL